METWECPSCGYKTDAAEVSCTMCGHPRKAAATDGTGAASAGGATSVQTDETSHRAASALFAAETARSCPVCGEPGSGEGLRVQTWTYAGASRNAIRYNVRTVPTAPLCAKHRSMIRTGRIAAAVLMVLPLPFLVYFARLHVERGDGMVAFTGLGLVLYTAYLLRWLRYGWADWALYGIWIHGKIARYIQTAPQTGFQSAMGGAPKVRLPVPWAQGALRYSAAAVLFAGALYLPLSEAPPETKAKSGETATEAGKDNAHRERLEQARKAALGGRLKTVEALVQEDPGLVRAGGRHGKTLLHLGARHPDVVTFLLGQGADPNAADGNEMTPLHWAVNPGATESVGLLVEAGARVDVADYRGQTPLEIARMRKRDDMVRLLERGDRGD